MAAARKSDAYQRFEEYLYVQLEGAAGSEPVEISAISDERLRVRLDATIWTRSEIVRETVPGRSPLGPVVADEEAARAELAEVGLDAAAHPAAAESIKKQLSDGKGVQFTDSQGAWREPPAPQTRSVVRKCGSCAGVGGFTCDACQGAGDRLCDRCDGAGKVDQVCPSCQSRSGRTAVGSRLIWDEGAFNFRLRRKEQGVDPDCKVCHGDGALTSECAQCEAAGRVTCIHCEGSGRIDCVDCDGTGYETDRYRPTLRHHYALHVSADRDLSPAAHEKLRRGVALQARLGLLKANLLDFQSNELGHRASFTAQMAFLGARIAIGKRSPRVLAEVYAVGEGASLVDPPPLVDILHQRALDRLRITELDGPRRVADALAARDLGRAALRAAARREFVFDGSEYAPMATQGFAQRMFNLSKLVHRHVGWRARRWFWPTAALLAPVWVASLDALGLTGAIAGWTSVAAASSGFEPEAAQDAAESGAIAARIGTLLLWWVAGLALSALIYRRTVSRTLGISRPATRWDALRAGPAAWGGLAVGTLLTLLFVAAPTPDPLLVARATDAAEELSARRGAERAKRSRAARGSEEWRLVQEEGGRTVAVILSPGPEKARFSLYCSNDAPVLRYTEGAEFLVAGAPISVGLSTNRRALGVAPTRVRSAGEVVWRPDQRTVSALRIGNWVRVELLDGEARRPIRQFSLNGSAYAIDEIVADCLP